MLDVIEIDVIDEMVDMVETHDLIECVLDEVEGEVDIDEIDEIDDQEEYKYEH